MKKIFLALPVIICLAGCATSYRVKVNGYLDTAKGSPAIPAGASFFINADKNVKNPIFENEIKSKIESLLLKNGYLLDSYEKADFIMNFVYTMSSGRLVSEVVPVYHSGETGTVRTYSSSGKDRISYVDYPGYTTYVPHKFTVYTSSLTLELYDADPYRGSNEKKKFWIGEAANTSENPDMREAINYLLIALFGHFGENTHTSIIANVSEDDPRLKELLTK